MQVTRVETFLHMVLHLTILAVVEDDGRGGADGFIALAAKPVGITSPQGAKSYETLVIEARGIVEDG